MSPCRRRGCWPERTQELTDAQTSPVSTLMEQLTYLLLERLRPQDVSSHKREGWCHGWNSRIRESTKTTTPALQSHRKPDAPLRKESSCTVDLEYPIHMTSSFWAGEQALTANHDTTEPWLSIVSRMRFCPHKRMHSTKFNNIILCCWTTPAEDYLSPSHSRQWLWGWITPYRIGGSNPRIPRTPRTKSLHGFRNTPEFHGQSRCMVVAIREQPSPRLLSPSRRCSEWSFDYELGVLPRAIIKY
jgi:hypothetical protein